MSEEIITALSKTPKLFVIARNSTFTYKGKPVKVQQVGRELGVKYVLEGSVRRAGDKVRITAQLVDAQSGNHLWAERYDRDLKDLFALQDEITLKIITALQVELTEGEAARVYGRGTKNLNAYVKVLQGREHAHRYNKEGNALAQKMFKEAIALDPEYAMAYWRLSATHLMDLLFGSTKSRQQSLEQAEKLAYKALALDGALAEAQALLGRIYLTKGQYERAIEEGERALGLDPNSYIAQYALAFTLSYSGRPEEAIALYKKAIRINPIPPSSLLTLLASAYRSAGRYEEAILTYKKVLHRNPDNLLAHLGLASVYSLSGRKEDARAEAAEALRIDPKFSLDNLLKGIRYKNQADQNLMIESLREAGLK
jgi:tetratricopeptide (TPR) repeat protein